MNYFLKVYMLSLLTSCSIFSNYVFAIDPAPNNKTSLEQKPSRTTKSQVYDFKENYSDLLFKVLLAETAKQRDLSHITLENYLAVAKETNNPQIAQLAVEYAIDIKDFKQAKEMAKLWADLDNQNIEPQIVAVTLLINTDLAQAKKYLLNAIAIDPFEMDQQLVLLYKKISPLSQKNLLSILTELLEHNSTDPFLYLYTAQLAAIEEQISAATSWVNHALTLKPNLTHAIQLKAKLIRYQAKNDKQALEYLATQANKFPEDHELIIFYSNALIDANKINQAIPLLKKVINNTAKHNTTEQNMAYLNAAKLALSEAWAIKGQYDKAKDILLNIPNSSPYATIANYYLGQIAEQQQELLNAVNYYTKVDKGDYHIPATLRAVNLLLAKGSNAEALNLVQNASPITFAEQKQLILSEIDILLLMQDNERALDIANNALLILPQDTDFLYARSIINNILDHHDESEHDLRVILDLEPQNANALNKLGFALATQPNRRNEALHYIKLALSLSPNNPTFLDSMGWTLYQMGKLTEALTILENAYAISKNSDIAAHLGEVLWTNGSKEKALFIWKNALKKSPNHLKIMNTLKKLKVELSAI